MRDEAVQVRALRLARDVAERSKAWQGSVWYWGDAILVDAMVAFGENDAKDWACERINAAASCGGDSWTACLAPGRAIDSLIDSGGVGATALGQLVDVYRRCPKTPEGLVLLRSDVSSWRSVVWIDCLYNLPVSLQAAGSHLGDEDLSLEAVRLARAVPRALAAGRGLAHFYDAGLRQNNGVAWTRGLGWALLGLLDLAEDLAPEDGVPVMEEAASLLQLLFDDERCGSWGAVLGDRDSATEASVTGFVVAAALHAAWGRSPVERPRMDDGLVARALSFLESVTEEGVVHGVSQDTHASWVQDDYRWPRLGASPWGQGSTLRGLVAICGGGDGVGSGTAPREL